jgi:hypothetical protein
VDLRAGVAGESGVQPGEMPKRVREIYPRIDIEMRVKRSRPSDLAIRQSCDRVAIRRCQIVVLQETVTDETHGNRWRARACVLRQGACRDNGNPQQRCQRDNGSDHADAGRLIASEAGPRGPITKNEQRKFRPGSMGENYLWPCRSARDFRTTAIPDWAKSV